MLKVTLLGAGSHSEAAHGPALAHYVEQHPGVTELAAVCDVREERARLFCERFAFRRFYTDFEEMLDKEKPDACWVVVPIDATRELVGRMMELGIPTLFEKPPGRGLREAEELAEISQRTGTPNMVAFNRRWAPCTVKALSWFGELGPIDYLYARMLRGQRMDERFAFGTGIHLLDCVRVLAAATAGGLASARTIKTESASRAFNFHVELVLQSGARGRCDILPTSGIVDESYTLFAGTKSVTFTLPWVAWPDIKVDGKAELWVDGNLADSESWPAEPTFLSGGFYGEAEEFLTALCEGRMPSPSAHEVLESVALAEAAQEGRELSF